jgi:hypothetical protein
VAALSFLLALAILALFSTNIMKFSALWAMRHQPAETAKPPLIAHLPTISIMVALYHESNIAALRRTRHRLHWLWALTMPAYHPLATLAAYKALWELLTKPFYWDKTSHGHFDP